MTGQMKWTAKQIEMVADVAKTWGILAVPGGLVDAAVDGSRRWLDALTFGAGILLIGVAVYLTGKLSGDTVTK